MPENKYEELQDLMGKIELAMQMTKEKKSNIEEKNSALREEIRPIMVEEEKAEINRLETEKKEFDEMTINALIRAKKEIEPIRAESEQKYQEMLIATLNKRAEIERKLQAMKERQLEPEKMQWAESSAQKALDKVNKEMAEFQEKHFEQRSKLDEYEKNIDEYAIELDAVEIIDRAMELEKKQPEKLQPEAPKTEPKQPEKPQPEAPKTEPKQPEKPQPEAPKTEPKQPEKPQPEAPKTEPKQPEKPQPEAPKAEPKQPEKPQPEAPKADEKQKQPEVKNPIIQQVKPKKQDEAKVTPPAEKKQEENKSEKIVPNQRLIQIAFEMNEDGYFLDVGRWDASKEDDTAWYNQKEAGNIIEEYELKPLGELDKETIDRMSQVGDKLVVSAIIKAAYEKRLTPAEAKQQLEAYEKIVNGEMDYEDSLFDIYYDVTNLRDADLTKEERKEIMKNAKQARDFGATVDAKWTTKFAWKLQDIAKSISNRFRKDNKALPDNKKQALGEGEKPRKSLEEKFDERVHNTEKTPEEKKQEEEQVAKQAAQAKVAPAKEGNEEVQSK